MSTCCTSNRYDPTLRQGATWRMGVRLREKATGDAFDLTGYTARLVVRKQSATGDEVAELTSEGEEITLDTELGRFEWALAMNFPAGKYAYSLRITAPDEGDESVPVWGTITLDADPNYSPT
jgi:hypothetical protein